MTTFVLEFSKIDLNNLTTYGMVNINSLKSQVYSLDWWKSWLYIFIGSSMVAVAFVFFITPYNIVPGGVYGIGVVLHYMFPDIQVGTFGFFLDVPLLILAIIVFGGSVGTRTIVAAIITPIVMNSLTYLVGGDDPAVMLGGRIDLSSDVIIACIFGGALSGTGVGLVIKARATTGGTDIVAMIITKFAKIPFSRSMLIVDSIIVIFGVIILNSWILPLYSLVTIFVLSRSVAFVVEGASYDKLLFIISEKHSEMKDFILDELGRGATYIKSHGMYTDRQKDMIFLVISRREVSDVQHKIKDIDPQSFVVVVDAYETFGDGFKKFPEKL